MRLSATTFAAMLMGLALTAFQPELDAQSRGNSRSSSTSRSTTSASRPSGTSARQASKPSGTKTRPADKPSAPSAKPQNKPKPDISPADRNPSRPSGNKPNKPAPKPDFKPGNQNRPVGVRPPAYRPAKPRPQPRPVVRPIVVRPAYGTIIAANIAADIAWTAVRLSYYNTVANTYSEISENNQYIAQQNAVIAQNNATIAAQNQIIAQTQTKAQAAYSLANELGLVQSYAAADASYFYQDGVFYSQGADGQYYVIVPPAGALVEKLPEDFEIVILNGKEYFRVDNTIYQMTVVEGTPYFEVLGQLN